MFRDQHSQLVKELSALHGRCSDMQEDMAEQEAQLHRLLCHPQSLEAIESIEECEEIERALKQSLELIDVKKVHYSPFFIAQCVICDVNRRH